MTKVDVEAIYRKGRSSCKSLVRSKRTDHRRMSRPEVDEEARALAVRRTVVVFLTLASLTGLGLAMGRVMAANGWSPPAILFLTLFLLSLPWTLLGFWNSVLGFVILRLVRDPVAFTNPALRATPEDSPI